MDKDKFVHDLKQALKDNEGNHKEFIEKVAPSDDIKSMMETLSAILEIEKKMSNTNISK